MTTQTSFGATAWQMTLMGLRYLNGRKLRTVLTTLAIVFGVALIFAINLTLPSLTDAFKQTLTGVRGRGHDASPARPANRSRLIRAGAGRRRRSRAGGQRQPATGQFTLPTLTDSALGDTSQINADRRRSARQTVRQFTMSDGRFLQPGDHGQSRDPGGLGGTSRRSLRSARPSR